MKKRDTLLVHYARLIESGVMSADSLQAIKDEIQKEVDKSVEFAEESPFPDVEEMLLDVYSKREPS